MNGIAGMSNNIQCAGAPRSCIDETLIELFAQQQRMLDMIDGMEFRLDGPHPTTDTAKIDFAAVGIMDKLGILVDRGNDIIRRTERIRSQL